MDRLSIVLTLIVGSALTGGLIIAVLALGWYSWLAIGGGGRDRLRAHLAGKLPDLAPHQAARPRLG